MVAFEQGRVNALRYQQLPGALCEQHVDYAGIAGVNEGLGEYLTQWEERMSRGGSGPQSYFIVADYVDCERSIGQKIQNLGGCTLNVLTDWNLDDSSCLDNKEKVEACTTASGDSEKGVLIESGNTLQCYGGSF